MDKYADRLKGDLVEQFRGKPNIEVFAQALAIQLQEVYDFFEQIESMCSLQTAVGKQLDGIGDIVVLSRAEASQLASSSKKQGEIIDDATYRKYLTYKILLNTSNCTYYDIIKAVDMFWDGPMLKYSEDPRYPATVFLSFKASNTLEKREFFMPLVKAGGVGLRLMMKKEDKLTVYSGFAVRFGRKRTVGCEIPESLDVLYLADEMNNILSDETGNRFID